MRIFKNSRTLRVLAWLYISVAGLLLGVALTALGWLSDSISILQSGLAVGGVFYVLAGGMELYARRYVTTIDLKDGQLVATSRSLTGTHTWHDVRVSGEKKQDRLLSTDTAVRISLLTNSLAALRLSGINNEYHIAEAGPANTKLIVDITADRKAGARIASAIAGIERKPPSPGPASEPGFLSRAMAGTGIFAWVMLHVAVLLIAMSWPVKQIEERFAREAVAGIATVTGKSHKRAGSDGRGVMEYFLRYTFETRQGKTIESGRKVNHSFQAGLKQGDRIAVRYLPHDPDFNSIEFSTEAAGSETLRMFGGLFAALSMFGLTSALVRTATGQPSFIKTVAGVFTLIALIGFAGWYAFGTGLPTLPGKTTTTLATITNKTESAEPSRREGESPLRLYRITYQYVDGSGATQTVTKTVSAETFHEYSNGEEIYLRYAGQNPALHDIASSPAIKGAEGLQMLGWLFTGLAVISFLVEWRRRRRKSSHPASA